MDMPPKLEYFPADFKLKSGYKRRGRHHDRHTQGYRHGRHANNQAGKIFPARKRQTTRYEVRKIQISGIILFRAVRDFFDTSF